jgi:hypothetical protein
VRFNVVTYETPEKLAIINTRDIVLGTKTPLINVKSIVLKTPPSNPSPNDSYYVPTGATGEWTHLSGNVVTWMEGVWRACGRHSLYNLETGRYMEFRGEDLVENPEFFDMRKFNAFFTTDKITGSSDIIKQIYKYLKTLPLYASAKDL